MTPTLWAGIAFLWISVLALVQTILLYAILVSVSK